MKVLNIYHRHKTIKQHYSCFMYRDLSTPSKYKKTLTKNNQEALGVKLKPKVQNSVLGFETMFTKNT